MTCDELADAVAHMTDALNHRVVIVRVILDAKGNEIGRVYRGSFTWHTTEGNNDPTRTWEEYFDLELRIEQVARRAGLSHDRAAKLARTLASRPPHNGRDLLLKLGTPASEDPTIVAAHRLLSQLEPDQTPPIEMVRVIETGAAYGKCIQGVIFISPSSPFYQSAQCGAPLHLAALLHHEEFHSRHADADEDAVREVTERFLQQHGGSHQ